MTRNHALACAALCALACAPPASPPAAVEAARSPLAQTASATLENLITGDSLVAGNLFGASVAMAAPNLAVGAPGRYGRGAVEMMYLDAQSGAVSEQVELFASDGTWGDAFGATLAMSGDTLVVGAPGRSSPTSAQVGAAYVFVQVDGGWTEQAELLGASDIQPAQFGAAVAIDGDTIAIGAPQDGYGDGAVYLFARANGVWTRAAALSVGNTSPSSGFGSAVALSNGTLAVGAPADSTNCYQAGAVYVFTGSGSTWAQQAQLTNGASCVSGLGSAVALDGDTVAASTPSGGAAIDIFVRSGSTWSLQTGTGVSTPVSWSSLALKGDVLVAGAPSNGVSSLAYQFVRSNGAWGVATAVVQPMPRPAGPPALAFDGSRLLVGAGPANDAYVVYTVSNTLVWDFGPISQISPQGVALDGDSAVVADQAAPTYGLGSVGDLEVFSRDRGAWKYTQQVTPFDALNEEAPGVGVALSGDVMVTAAPYASGPNQAYAAGKVFVYARQSGLWHEAARLQPVDAGPISVFGVTLGASDSTVAVGELRRDDRGEIYLYGPAADGGWEQTATIDPPAHATDGGPTLFGYVLALRHGELLTSEPWLDAQTGAAYLYAFDGGGWTLEDTLLSPSPEPGATFGLAVALDGDLAVVGAPGTQLDAGSRIGAAYVFARVNGAWQPDGMLAEPSAYRDAQSGFAVAVSGPVAALGSVNHGVWIWVRRQPGHWDPAALVDPFDGGVYSVALEGSRLAVSNNSAAALYQLSFGLGDPCADPTACASGYCVDGVCCETAACPAPADACRVAVCQPYTGTCAEQPAADGTACDDGNACTQTDLCRSGSCVGGNPVSCAAADACHGDGTCDALTGACSTPVRPDGTVCGADGALGLCTAGSCVPVDGGLATSSSSGSASSTTSTSSGGSTSGTSTSSSGTTSGGGTSTGGATSSGSGSSGTSGAKSGGCGCGAGGGSPAALWALGVALAFARRRRKR